MNILDIAIKEVGGIPTLDKMLSIRDQVVRQWNKKRVYILWISDVKYKWFGYVFDFKIFNYLLLQII
ncbi:hypothetical protein C6H68_20525 [Photorhabdus luminescens]|nr:hypothetical protein C6H68_20525 [Photorhabdus luminescens]